MQLQNTAAKERSSTVLRFASFLCSILKRSGGAVAVGTRVTPRHGASCPDVVPARTSAGVLVSSLVGRLPSMPSADELLPSLFGHFAGNTRPSDPLPTFMLGLWLITFPNRPARIFASGVGRASRSSRVEFPCMRGSSTSRSPMGARNFAPTSTAFRPLERRRHSGLSRFRG